MLGYLKLSELGRQFISINAVSATRLAWFGCPLASLVAYPIELYFALCAICAWVSVGQVTMFLCLLYTIAMAVYSHITSLY